MRHREVIGKVDRHSQAVKMDGREFIFPVDSPFRAETTIFSVLPAFSRTRQ